MKRKSIVPPAVLLAFAIASALTGFYGIITNDIPVMILSIIWLVLGGLATILSNFIFNRGR